MRKNIYRGSKTNNTGSDTTTYGTVTYSNTHTDVSGAYTGCSVKDGSSIKYIKSIQRGIEADPPYHLFPRFEEVKEGWVYTANGWKQFFGKPSGIQYLANIAIMKASPYTLAVSIGKNYGAYTLLKVTPTGLNNLSKVFAIRIVPIKYDYGKIVIAGLTTNNRFGIWECSGEDYNFNFLWEDSTTYASYGETSDIGGVAWTASEYIYSTVLVTFYINNNSNVKTKLVELIYDRINDVYHNTVSTTPVLVHLNNSNFGNYNYLECCLGSSNTGVNYNHLLYSNKVKTGTFPGNFSTAPARTNTLTALELGNGKWILSTVESSTGYTYLTLDGGSTYERRYYGDNAYRMLRRSQVSNGTRNEAYFWAAHNGNANYCRGCGIDMDDPTHWWSSKITFPTSTNFSNRVEIADNAFIILGSSTVCMYDYTKIISGTDQTVTTTNLTDGNGNNFTVKDAFWNVIGNGGWGTNTFYTSTDETNGKLLSENGSGGTFHKQTIEVGGPLLLQKYQW